MCLWDTLVGTALCYGPSRHGTTSQRGTAVNEILERLIAALAAGETEFAAALSEVSDLAQLDGAIVEFSNSFAGKDAYSVEEVAEIRGLADLVGRVRTESARRFAATQEVSAQVAEAFSQIAPPVAEAEEVVEEETAEEVAEEPAPVVAAGRTAAPALLSRLAASRKTPKVDVIVPEQRKQFLVAAADVPGMPTGGEYRDWDELAEAAERRWNSFGSIKRGNRQAAPRAGLALFKLKFPQELTMQDSNDAYKVAEYAAKEGRLPGGSLVAAGGWCAPSENLYDVCEMETRDGLLQVPEISAGRGGINHSTGPDFSSIFSAVGFNLTEAQAIAGDAKNCFEVPCPSFSNVRLNAIGVCLVAGILQEAGYPEFVARYLRGSLVVHAHKVNEFRLDAMVTGSTAVNLSAVGYFTAQGFTSGLLEAAELQIEDAKHKNRLAQNGSLEVVLPQWTRGVIRADLSKRTGVDLLDVTDETIRRYFADRHANVQFVYDFQDAAVDGGTGLGGSSAATAWPATAKFLVYPAGTWVAATKDVITLDAGIYDSTNITTNKYTALFTEQGQAMLKRCTDSRLVTVPLCASGETSATADMDCA